MSGSGKHPIVMDSTPALSRLEVTSTMNPDSGLSGRMNHAKNFHDGARAQLKGCIPLSHQVAGHKYGINKVGILQHPDGTVLKQLQPPPRGPREMQFYCMVYDENCSDPYLLDLQQYLPKYYGTWTFPGTPNDLYLKLEDVSRRFNKPCIMDVKIGQRSYDPYASQEKQEQQISKYPLMEEIGFLVLGMRIYQVTSDSYKTYNQHYGRSLVKDTIKDGLAKFFNNGKGLRKDAIISSIQKVQKILQWFEGQKQLHFYASSLLFVYEGSPELGEVRLVRSELPKSRGEPKESNNVHVTGLSSHGHMAAACFQSISDTYVLHTSVYAQQPYGDTFPETHCSKQKFGTSQKFLTQVSLEHPYPDFASSQLVQENNSQDSQVEPGCSEVEVRMIDFAHVFPSETRDDGYIYGLKNLLWGLQEILHD
ncbi:inositol polyphosphate multikinase-like [Scleropages formosus]|uniref:Kinase n=2 Tax=Scleropages formosus TaxID=113540 RepID=A0A8C9TTC5_SCLFO|nr:inositol polyphosphate multikinase-like [Scleropages formosus]XP_029107390.1 inositol polyphosphate multikinase-like [Scleropages formosus]